MVRQIENCKAETEERILGSDSRVETSESRQEHPTANTK
jgi:hypothetical protein